MTSKETISEQVNALGPWHHRIRLGDGSFTDSDIVQDESGAQIVSHDADRAFENATRQIYPDGLQGRSFLDCACKSGGYAFAATDRGAGRVLGLDSHAHCILQARFAARHREGDASDILFEVGSPDDLATSAETYDVTWFKNIFHRLADPIASLKQAADHTGEVLFIDTACAWFDVNQPEKPELVLRQAAVKDAGPLRAATSWLPSGPVVLGRILSWMGFSAVRTYIWVQDDMPDDGAPRTRTRPGRIAMAAARDAASLRDMIDLKAPNAKAGQRAAAPVAPASGPSPASASAAASAGRAEETRPLRWEDDLSAHALDTAPFELVPPVAEWEVDAFGMIGAGRGLEDIGDLPLLDMARRDTAPLPVRQDREGYGDDNHEFYWLSGLRDYHLTSQIVARHGVTINTMMDIGCASGRVLRHFAFQSDIPEIWGCDINHRHIRFLETHMPHHVRPITMPALPHYPVEDNYFDLVTAFSVFTHIDVFETAFLAEVRRMLRPGALGYLTVSSESHWARLQQGEGQNAKRLSSRLAKFSPEAAETLKGPLTAENRYFRHTQTGPYRGVVFTPEQHIERVWSRFFKIEEIIPFGHADQAVVVVRK